MDKSESTLRNFRYNGIEIFIIFIVVYLNILDAFLFFLQIILLSLSKLNEWANHDCAVQIQYWQEKCIK